MNIKAIETTYNGYRFRSRLEARWAVFFDQLGIRYKYEEYGFEAHGYKWLPDFYLPDVCAWVEVKGGTPSGADVEKMAVNMDWDSPMPFVTGSRGVECLSDLPGDTTETAELARSMGRTALTEDILPGVMLLGDVPKLCLWEIAVHPVIQHNKGLEREYFSFKRGGGARYADGPPYNSVCGWCCHMPDAVPLFTPDVYTKYTRTIEDHFPTHITVPAYQAARSARFEHGESGTLRGLQ